MEEEVYHAELADAKRETNILNGLAGTTIAVAIVFLMLGVTLDAVVDKSASPEEDLGMRVPVWERGNLNYVTDQDNGFVMEFGPYELLENAQGEGPRHDERGSPSSQIHGQTLQIAARTGRVVPS